MRCIVGNSVHYKPLNLLIRSQPKKIGLAEFKHGQKNSAKLPKIRLMWLKCWPCWILFRSMPIVSPLITLVLGMAAPAKRVFSVNGLSLNIREPQFSPLKLHNLAFGLICVCVSSLITFSCTAPCHR